MKRFFIGLLIVGSVVAAIALIVRKRAASDPEQWDSFAGDTYARASETASKMSDSAKDTVSKLSESAKDVASDVSDTAKDTASKVSDTAKDAASKMAKTDK